MAEFPDIVLSAGKSKVRRAEQSQPSRANRIPLRLR